MTREHTCLDRCKGCYDTGYGHGESEREADFHFWLSERLEVPDGFDIWEMMDMVQITLRKLPNWPDCWPSGAEWQAWLDRRPEKHIVFVDMS